MKNWSKVVKELEKEASKHKQTEEALRESEERFKEMMADLLPTIISELDKNSYLIYTNQAASETFHYSRADLEDGLNVIDKVHPDDKERAIKNTKKVIKRKKLDATEYTLFKEDSSELTMLVLARPLYKNGKVVHARSTEHKFPNDRFYKFYRLVNEQGKFIYIQERQLDEFRAINVKGGIMVKDEDFMHFMKELRKFVMEVTDRESKTRS